MIIFCKKHFIHSDTMPRGRNKHLIEQRNSALIRRYYYWTEVQRLRFDDA